MAADEGEAERIQVRQVQILGPCRVVEVGAGGASPEIAISRTQRVVLCRLAVAAPGPVSPAELSDAVWGERSPPSARAALQNQVSRIRSSLGADSILTTDDGYRLGLPTDAQETERALVHAEAAFAAGDAQLAFSLADAALGRWRGPVAPELGDLDQVFATRRWLDELRHALENVRLGAALVLGRIEWSVVEAERLVAQGAHDERRWVLQMQALEAAGRRGDALGTFERARRVLVEDLGLGAGPALREAEAAILAADATSLPRWRAPFIGRDRFLSSALPTVDAGGVVLLSGEAGIGKSSLLDEASRRMRRSGIPVARAACLPHAESAVQTLTELLESLGLERDSSLPPIPGFVDALRSRSDEGRIVLVVDDLDQAGPTSMAALRGAAALPAVGVLAAAKDPDLCDPLFADSAVPVEPLSRDEVEALAAAILEIGVADLGERVDWLTAMSGGNPLMLECLLSDAGLRTAWTSDDPAAIDPDALPTSPALRDLVRRRLQRLGSTTRTAIEIAAVCGLSCPLALLQRLAPAAGIAGALASGLLVEVESEDEPVVGFRHGALHRIVYHEVAPGRRVELHDTAANVLRAAGGAPSSVARHALAAVELDPVAASERAIEAAAAATEQGAHAEAAQWFERGARAAGSAGARGERWRVRALIGRGDALRLAGAADQEDALFEAAHAAITFGDPELVGDAAFALLQLGATTESGSLHRQAIDVANVALAVVRDREQRARVAAAASLTHSMTGHPDLCRELFREAERDARSSVTRRAVLPFAYLALGHPADLDERERLTDELLALAAEADDPQAGFEAAQLSFSVGLQRGDGQRVRRAVEESARLVDRAGDIGRRWSLVYQRAAVAHLRDELDVAERLSEEALALFADVSPSRAFAVYGAQLLVIRHAQGRLAELVEPLEGLLADQPGVPAWNAALALSLVEVDPDRGRELAAAALQKAPHDFTWLATHVIGGQAAALLQDHETIDAYRERLAPWSGLGCWQGTCSYGPVDLPLALLAAAAADDRAVEDHTLLARRFARSLDAPVFERHLDVLLAGG